MSHLYKHTYVGPVHTHICRTCTMTHMSHLYNDTYVAPVHTHIRRACIVSLLALAIEAISAATNPDCRSRVSGLVLVRAAPACSTQVLLCWGTQPLGSSTGHYSGYSTGHYLGYSTGLSSGYSTGHCSDHSTGLCSGYSTGRHWRMPV